MAWDIGWWSLVKSRIFLRFAIIGSIISVVFLAIAIATSNFMRDLVFEEPFREGGPFSLVQGLVDRVPPQERVRALSETGRPQGPRFIDFYLADEKGNVLFPGQVTADEQALIEKLVHDLPVGGTASENNRRIRVYKLSGEPVQYFLRSQRPRPPPPPLEDKTFILMNLIQVTTIIAAVLVTLALLIYSLRSRARAAEAVIKELTHGNLKARFPVTITDEVGQVMFSFNKMADEIERLVENLKKTESTRRDLLRELAHDLRTPIASMKSLLETLRDRKSLSDEKRTELLNLVYRESEYFEGLVNDLLFLGRVQEPTYKNNLVRISIEELVQAESEAIKTRYPKIKLHLQNDGEAPFVGDVDLIRRMIRNAVENAFSFARTEVAIHIRHLAGSKIEIVISDDGPGFSAASMESFGQRKYSRATGGEGQRISIGLGSVIMTSVAQAYRGQVIACNRLDGANVLGADVKIILPQ